MTQPDHIVLTDFFNLRLTSILSVSGYVAVLWPELWLQCQSDQCLRGCSGAYLDMKTLEFKQIPCFCCSTTRGTNDIYVTIIPTLYIKFQQKHQNIVASQQGSRHYFYYGTVVAIAIDHRFRHFIWK